jgi:hypothetical protein
MLWLDNAERAVIDAKEDILKLIKEVKKNWFKFYI